MAQDGKKVDTPAAGSILDAWLGNASRPEREVTLYAANSLQAEIARLEDERDGLIESAQQDMLTDEEMSQVQPRAQEIQVKINAARKRLISSGMVFRVRAIDEDTLDEIVRVHEAPSDATDEDKAKASRSVIMHRIAQQVVEPAGLSVDDLERVRLAIGEVEFLKLANASFEVNSGVSASSPFWRANSGRGRS